MKLFRTIARKFGILVVLAGTSALAQNSIYVFPPSTRTPVGGTQSITAVVTGNANKTVSWSTTCGTLVGSGNTIGLKSTSTQTCTVTGTMAADGVTSASAAVTFEAVRTDLQAASTHPRIGLTPADVTDLQTKAASGTDVAYTKGLAVYFSTRQAYYNAHFCWTGAGCGTVGPIGTVDSGSGWIDGNNGFNAVGGGPFEQDNLLYALMALIDPTTSNRATWAAHAHDLSMWEMNEICYGAATGSGACVARSYTAAGGNSNAAFTGSGFILNNRAQTNTLPQVQAIDWNYGSFSAADKAVIAQVGHIWGTQLTGAYLYDAVSGGNEHVTPIGAYNTPAIISGSVSDEEGGSNNYALGHWQAMAAIGVLLDPADDPGVSSCATSTTTICATDGTAKTVAAYGVYAVKGWLYRLYANFEDQHIVNSAYGLSDPFLCPDTAYSTNGKTTACTGSMSGGFPAEGTGYGALSMSEMFPTIYLLYTAGKLNPANDPQASFISSSYWDKLAISFVHQLYPDQTGSNGGSYTQFASDQSYSVFTQQGTFFNFLEVYDGKYGSTFRKNLDKWYQYNVLYGGYANFFGRFMGANGLGNGDIGFTYFPVSTIEATSATNDGDFAGAPLPNAYDPRTTATLPIDFENLSSAGGFYRFYGRNNWSTTATQFQFGCHTSTQDHAMPSCGRFDYLRGGEPLVTALGGTSNNDSYAQGPTHQNMPGYQWNPSADCNNSSADYEICMLGGMADQGWQLFSNTVLATSSNSAYYYGAIDASGAYNSSHDGCQWCSAFANVSLSQREILWLRPDQIFVYDRAATSAAGTFKNFYLDLQTTPAISGNRATMTSKAGQLLYVTSLLPGTSSLSASALDLTHEPGAPVSALLTDQGPTTASVRMLHVLEGKASGAATSTNLVQSTAGTAFDGGVIGGTIVLFKQTLTDTFASVTYAASGATTHYVAGLAPSHSYAIAGAGAPSTATTDSAGVLTFTAAGTGSITVGSAGVSLVSVAVSPASATLSTSGTQQYGATCIYSDGSTVGCTSSVTWSSSARGVATVNAAGLATGVAAGSANISASSGGVQGQGMITIAAATLKSIAVTPASVALAIGGTQQFKATGTYSDSSTADVTGSVTWSSSSSAVVSAGSAGLATAVAAGSANVVATIGSVQGQGAVTVSAATSSPAFSPAAGTYPSTQTVTISTASAGAKIYYTTNGSMPTTSSAAYSGAIAVSSSETVQAIAVANGSTSAVASAVYTIGSKQAGTPAFSPAGGTYGSWQTVTISTTTPSSLIYYTLNGDITTTALYTKPITVSGSETVQAAAFASGYIASSVGSTSYTISLPQAASPTFSVSSGTYSSAQKVTIASTIPSAVVYYTTNGLTPTNMSAVYTGPITVSFSETVKAIAVASGHSTSPVASAGYIIKASR